MAFANTSHHLQSVPKAPCSGTLLVRREIALSDTTEYGKHNNTKIDTVMPDRCSYCYHDTRQHRADQLFIRSEIPVDFEDHEFHHPDFEYVLVFRLFKKYGPAFLQCMADLDRALRIERSSDYGSAVDFLASLFEDEE